MPDDQPLVTQDAPALQGPLPAPQAGPTPPTSSDPSTATLPQQPVQQGPVANQPAPTNPMTQRHNMLGAAFSALMGQGPPTYRVDPNTGQTVATPTQEKPGQMFRSLLAGAIMGGAASAASVHSGNGMEAAGVGAQAVQQNQQQQDLLRRKQAQQDFQNSQSVDNESRRNQLMDAQLAQMHAEAASRQQHSDLESQEAHDRHNAASAALAGHLEEAGGVPAVIPVNGESKTGTLTANELSQAIVKDPSVIQGPDGYVRHFIDSTDGSEISYNGLHWVDSSGTPVNTTDNVTVKAIDVPRNVMATKITTTGKDINAAYGGKLVDPSQSYPMSPLDMDALNTKRLKDAKEQAQTDLEKKKVAIEGAQVANQAVALRRQADTENRQQFLGAATMIKDRITSLEERAKDPMMPTDQKKLLNDQIDRANTELKGYFEKAYPGMKMDDVFASQTAAPAAGGIPAGAITATNPQTGAKSYSTDGGKTWNVVGAPAAPANNAEPISSGFGPLGQGVKNFLSTPVGPEAQTIIPVGS